MLPILLGTRRHAVAAARRHPTDREFAVTPDLTRKTVSKLGVSWIYPTGDERSYQFNPVIVDDVMYVLAKNSSLVAIDVVTARNCWIHANLRGITNRGINFWRSKDGKQRRAAVRCMDDLLQAIDARTGKSIAAFGKNGVVDLREGLGRDPATIRRIHVVHAGTRVRKSADPRFLARRGLFLRAWPHRAPTT